MLQMAGPQEGAQGMAMEPLDLTCLLGFSLRYSHSCSPIPPVRRGKFILCHGTMKYFTQGSQLRDISLRQTLNGDPQNSIGTGMTIGTRHILHEPLRPRAKC